MKQVSQNYRSGDLAVREVPAPMLRSRGVIVATTASLLSAGTEKAITDLAKASLAGKAFARPDLVRQVIDKAKREGVVATFAKVRSKLDNPVALGYSCAGRVVEGDSAEFKPGARVACAGAGYATHADFNYIPHNLCVPIPDGVDDDDAAFIAVGAIALQGVRQAQPTLGERVVVIGLGLLGLITVQLLKANGCRVLGFDPVSAKGELARRLGADASCADGLIEAADSFTGGLGADAVIVTASTTSDQPVNLAAAISRLKGRVVLVGMVGMKLDREPFYKKELELKLSMSYGPGRYDPAYEEGGYDYPFSYVRWTERRNMQAFLELIADGRVAPKALVTHRFDIAEAEKAYALLRSAEPYIGILITYPDAMRGPIARRVEIGQRKILSKAGTLGVGFIGAGNFAKSVLLPALRKMGGVRLTGVVTANGLSGTHAADTFGFRFATTDSRDLLDDQETDVVFVATRHDTHAPLAAQALKAGKHVFVEKPLAIDQAQLDEVTAAAEASDKVLMVGFNRRFAPLIRQAKEALKSRTAPLMMLYRINAGPVPADSWIQGEEGAGRIIGEVCHFIDTLSFIADSLPVERHLIAAKNYDDAVSLQLRFADGSVGTIVYSSLGDRSFPKESIEVFGAGRVITIDDFRRAIFVADGRTKRHRLARQDKGFDEELSRFLAAVRGDQEPPISLHSLVTTTVLTFPGPPDLHASGEKLP